MPRSNLPPPGSVLRTLRTAESGPVVCSPESGPPDSGLNFKCVSTPRPPDSEPGAKALRYGPASVSLRSSDRTCAPPLRVRSRFVPEDGLTRWRAPCSVAAAGRPRPGAPGTMMATAGFLPLESQVYTGYLADPSIALRQKPMHVIFGTTPAAGQPVPLALGVRSPSGPDNGGERTSSALRPCADSGLNKRGSPGSGFNGGGDQRTFRTPDSGSHGPGPRTKGGTLLPRTQPRHLLPTWSSSQAFP